MMCLNDDSVEKIFQGKEFADFFYSGFLVTRHCTFLSHNWRSYDNFFILRSLEAQGHFPDKLQDGCRLTMVTVPGINCCFVDTLSFMPRSLAELPFDLGIENLVVKGFFPYTFTLLKTSAILAPSPKEIILTWRPCPQKSDWSLGPGTNEHKLSLETTTASWMNVRNTTMFWI